jgi:hypothetical protein
MTEREAWMIIQELRQERDLWKRRFEALLKTGGYCPRVEVVEIGKDLDCGFIGQFGDCRECTRDYYMEHIK